MIMKIARCSRHFTAAMTACLGIAGGASAGPVHLFGVQSEVDIISLAQSPENQQNWEPSIAVNPTNPAQMIAGSFGNGALYWRTNNRGATWSDFGTLSSNDKSIAWRQDGAAALTATAVLNPDGSASQIRTFQ